MAVENKANAPVLVALEGEDPDEELSQPLTEPQKRGFLRRRRGGNVPGVYGPRVYKPQVYAPGVNIGPGGISLCKPSFSVPQFQGPQMKSVNLDANSAKSKLGSLKGGAKCSAPAGPLLSSQGVFRQKAWLPWWLIPVALLLAALAVALYLVLPKNVVVPEVVGMSATDATQVLAERGLTRGTDERVESRSEPGTVLAQSPQAGLKLREGRSVGLTVSVGRLTRVVPDVVGLPLLRAQRRLNARGFEVGRIEPLDAEPGLEVRFQNPAAGRRWRVGTPVALALGPDAARPSADVTPSPGDARVPSDRSPVPTAPARDRLRSELAYADKRGRVWLRPQTGPARPIVAAAARQRAWHPDGRLATLEGADVEQAQVVLRDLAGGAEPEAITDRGPYRRPAFSPDGDVLAVIRADFGTGAGVLCFAPFPPGGVPDCLEQDPDWVYARPVWSPAGDAVLVLARERDTKTYTRLVAFRRVGPDGSQASAWQAVEPPLLQRPLLQFADWAPEGVAVLESPSSGTAAHLTIYEATPALELRAARELPALTGCQLGWEPGGRIAIAERGCSAEDSDGPVRLFDLARTEDRGRVLTTSGADPAFRPVTP